MARLCGATLGLFAFSVTIFLSLSAANSIEETLWRALNAMVIFCGMGLAVGWVAGRVLDEYAVGRHREMFADEGKGTGSESQSVPAGEEASELPPVTS